MQPDRITTAEVMHRIDRKEKLVFVDVRSAEDWASSEEIIGGATRVPPDAIQVHAGRLPNLPLVVYGAHANDQTSLAVARDLTERGFRHVYVLEGGLDAWKRAKGHLSSKPTGGEREKITPPHEVQETGAHDVGRSAVGDNAWVPREGVGAGHVVETPVATMPSAHRKQPDEMRTMEKSSAQERSGDARKRVEPPATPETTPSQPGDRQSKRFEDRPSQHH